MNYTASDTAAPRPTIGRPWTAPLSEGNDVTDFIGFVDTLNLEPWMEEASCATAANPDAWFPVHGTHDGDTKAALRVCRMCPVASPCLYFALAHPTMRGIWGGTTERQRRAFFKTKETA